MKMATKYRIIQQEWFDDNNIKHTSYEPQKKSLWFFWCGFPSGEFGFNRRFKSLEAAEKFLNEVDDMGGTTDKSTVIAEYR